MGKYMSNILISFLAAVSFIQTAAGQVWRRADIDDGLVEKDTYCLFSSITLLSGLKYATIPCISHLTGI